MPMYPRLSSVVPTNLPHMGVIIREETSFLDMDNKVHIALIIRWIDMKSQMYESRVSAFDSITGEYLGECVA